MPCLVLLALSASCVHDRPMVGAAPAAAPVAPEAPLALAALADPPLPSADAGLSPQGAMAANAALPVSRTLDSGAAPLLAAGATAIDQLRSLDCLAQAIYYEARSESDAGQRAVAQVVLNRLRHPAYPSSVCGVVYQGPMRAGGGCQFTFTCDGSLARTPSGVGWLNARRIAAEALSGGVYAPVGHATHYHTTSVFPHWAPKLVKAALIGSHIFYRFPGSAGAPQAFSQAYAGREPAPVAARSSRARPQLQLQLASLVVPAGGAQADPASLVSLPPDNLPKVRLTERGLPDSRVREAYRNAGQMRALPAGGEDPS